MARCGIIVLGVLLMVCGEVGAQPGVEARGGGAGPREAEKAAGESKAPEYERREFSFDAPRLTTFRWTSEPVKDGDRIVRQGLSYTWSLPEGLEAGKACDLLIVCHPVGKDSTWAAVNLPQREIGNRIMIAPEGTSAITQGVRSFRHDQADVLAFREFVLEMTQAFPADRIYLAGFEHGGSFALVAAGYFPGLTEGVVAMSSEVWAESPTRGGVLQVPLVFVQGTADGRAGIGVWRKGRAAYESEEHPMVRARWVHGGGREPRGVLVRQGLDWCDGMVSSDASGVLAAGKRLMGSGEDDGGSAGFVAPALGAAAEVLGRLLGESEANPAREPIEEVPAEVRAEAKALIERINGHAALHIAAIAREVTSERSLVVDGKAWVGHVMAMRDDFRGVPAVERFMLRSGIGTLIAEHEKVRGGFEEAAGAKEEKARFEGVMEVLPRCFMVEGMTPGFFEDLARVRGRAEEIGLSEEAVERYEMATLLREGLEKGMAQYRATLRMWEPEGVKARAVRPR